MKTVDKVLAVLSVATAIVSLVTAGSDLAYAITRFSETNYFMAFIYFFFSIWLFYWGYRNSRNAVTLIKEWIYER